LQINFVNFSPRQNLLSLFNFFFSSVQFATTRCVPTYLPTHRPANQTGPNQTGQGTTNPELLRRQRIPTRTTVDSPTSFLPATSRGNYSPYYLPTRPANETGQGTTNPELLGRQRIPARTTVDSLQASRLLPCFSTTKTQTGPCPNSSAGCSELRTTVDSPQTWALCARALNLLFVAIETSRVRDRKGETWRFVF